MGAGGSRGRAHRNVLRSRDRGVVEVRRWADGGVAWRVATYGAAVVLSTTRVAVVRNVYEDGGTLTAKQVDVWERPGSLITHFDIPVDAAPEFGLSGRWFIYRTGYSIRATDITSGTAAVLTTVKKARVIGLSVSGRRVAWAEQRRGRDLIRAIRLPS